MPRPLFIYENDIGFDGQCQKYSASFAGSQSGTGCLHRSVRCWRHLDLNPRGCPNLLGSRQSCACNDDFVVNFTWNCYLAVELTEKIKLLGAGESDEGRRIRNDDHEPKRLSVRRSSSRSERLYCIGTSWLPAKAINASTDVWHNSAARPSDTLFSR